MPNIIEEMFRSFGEMTIEEIINTKNQYFQQHGYSDIINRLVADYIIQRENLRG